MEDNNEKASEMSEYQWLESNLKNLLQNDAENCLDFLFVKFGLTKVNVLGKSARITNTSFEPNVPPSSIKVEPKMVDISNANIDITGGKVRLTTSKSSAKIITGKDVLLEAMDINGLWKPWHLVQKFSYVVSVNGPVECTVTFIDGWY